MMDVDPKLYRSLELDVYGNGEESGKLKVELYDNDSGKTEIEVDKNWKPVRDDLFTYEVNIDWKGWKHVSIPFSEMKSEGKGSQKADAKFIKLQLICNANAESGSVDFNVDNLELGVAK